MAHLTVVNNRFVFRCSYNSRELPKSAGFSWDDSHKVWWTSDLAVAARLRHFADRKAEDVIERILLKCVPWTKPLPPTRPGKTLMPHQEEALRFSLSRNKCYLALDPGLGKTAVAAIKAQMFRKVAYFAPPFLVDNVIEEMNAWSALAGETFVFKDTELLNPDLYPALERELIKGINPKDTLLVVDEAHRFKSYDAKRTKALLGYKKEKGVIDLFQNVVFMSGTPMPNSPIELFPILSAAAPEVINFMNQFQYGLHYCAGYQDGYGWNFKGSSNMAELRSRMIAPEGPFMLRIKKDVLDLPPKIEEVLTLTGDMSEAISYFEGAILGKYKSADDIIKHRLAKASAVDTEDLHIASYRKILGVEKARLALPYIKSLLDETKEKMVVFAYHHEAIKTLVKSLEKEGPLVITGETPVERRNEVVKKFQEDENCRLLIGNYLAMGVGFTITKATRAIFVEFDWVPSTNKQAADRLHRIGQKGTVYVQYLVLKGSLDKLIIQTLLRKEKVTSFV